MPHVDLLRVTDCDMRMSATRIGIRLSDYQLLLLLSLIRCSGFRFLGYAAHNDVMTVAAAQIRMIASFVASDCVCDVVC